MSQVYLTWQAASFAAFCLTEFSSENLQKIFFEMQADNQLTLSQSIPVMANFKILPKLAHSIKTTKGFPISQSQKNLRQSQRR